MLFKFSYNYFLWSEEGSVTIAPFSNTANDRAWCADFLGFAFKK